MSDFVLGSHDKGMWDRANPVKAKVKPIAENLTPQKALEQAQANPGAELIIVSKQGKASIHSLSIEKQFGEDPKKVDIKELSPNRVPKDMAKTPLVIENDPAVEFGAQYAFIVDDNKQIGMTGDYFSKSLISRGVACFLQGDEFPGQYETAYLIAASAGQKPKVLDALVANEIGRFVAEGKLTAEEASKLASNLRDKDIKAKLTGLLNEAGGLSANRGARTKELEDSLKTKTQQLDKQVGEARGTRNQTLAQWQERHADLTGQISRAEKNLHEVRVPGINGLMARQEKSVAETSEADAEWRTAAQRKASAVARENELSGMPQEAQEVKAQLDRQQGSLDAKRNQLVAQMKQSLFFKNTEQVVIGIGGLLSDEGMSHEDERRFNELNRQKMIAQQVVTELEGWHRTSPTTMTHILGSLTMDWYDSMNLNLYVMGVKGLESDIAKSTRDLDYYNAKARELPGAREAAAAATSQEATKAGELKRAQGQLQRLTDEIAEREANALPDSNPVVKAAHSTLTKLQTRYTEEVGAEGTLTRARNSAQTNFDTISQEREKTVSSAVADLQRHKSGTSRELAQKLTGIWNEGVQPSFQDIRVDLPSHFDKPRPISSVSSGFQAEIDWALSLENKVKQGYQPTQQETTRYQDIAKRLVEQNKGH